MTYTNIRSIDCSIPNDGAAVLPWNSSDVGLLPGLWAAAQGDESESGPDRTLVGAAWAVLTLGIAVVHAGRLIPWWLFALVLLLVLAHHS